MAEYTQKQWDALSSQRQFMQRRRIPSSRPIITDIQSIVKPRRRTNNKAFEVKKGRAVPGRTGIGGFVAQEIPGESSGTAVFVNEEVGREYKMVDGCKVAVRSLLKYSDDSEIWFTWLDPDDPRITEVS